jgi:hypothetical protein
MATLYLDPEPEQGAWHELHGWLGGGWALLFSNPEDFQPLERQKRPWLAAMRQEFGARRLHALTVERDAGSRPPNMSSRVQALSWVDDLRGNPQAVWLGEPPFAAADAVSFAARALRGELLTARSRFVMLIDGSLKRREMLRYGSGASAVSPAVLLSAVDALRGQRSIGRAA